MATPTMKDQIDKRLGHYRQIIIDRAAKTFDADDLNERIDDIMLRMIEIVFEQESLTDFNALIDEAARDNDIKEIN